MKLRISHILVTLTCVLASCSTTSQLAEDEYLYTGIKRITTEGRINTEEEQLALEEVNAALACAPNNSLMGSSSVRTPFPLGLWAYNSFVNNKKGFGRWLYKMFASQPVTITTVNPTTRAKIATNILQNYGYFQGQVDYEIIKQKNPKKQKVAYNIHLGQAYTWDSIEYHFSDLEQDSIVRASKSKPIVAPGKQFSVIDLQAERERINSELRNSGYYYYRPDYVTFVADSSQESGKVKLRILPSEDIPERAIHQYHFGRMHAYLHPSSGYVQRSEFTDSVLNRPSKSLMKEFEKRRRTQTSRRRSSFRPQPSVLHYTGNKPTLQPNSLFRNIKFRHHQLFSQDLVDASITNLNSTSLFSNVILTFTPRDTIFTHDDTLDVRLDAILDKPIDIEFDFSATQKSNSRVGPSMELKYNQRNAFGRGETLSFGLKGSYEWFTGRSNTDDKSNAYEYGINASVTYPWIVFPWMDSKIKRRTASTTFKIELDNMNRSNYYKLRTFNIEAMYKFKANEYVSHTFVPLTLKYMKLLDPSYKFDSLMIANPALYAAYQDQFVPAIQYVFNYDNTLKPRSDDKKRFVTTAVELTFKESANIISAVKTCFGDAFASPDRKIFGMDFSQFLKLQFTLRNKFMLTPNSCIATRLLAGVIYSYGRYKSAPYSELFYVGGANDIRAFAAHTLGPGSYRDKSGIGNYLDQAGDVKLEANVEYRFPVVGSLNGAVFVDAGNVWLIRDTGNSRDAYIGNGHFLRDIAIGTGFGLRYNLDFLVIRADVGFGLHAPYDTGRSGYFNIEKFRDCLGFHLAVGYPF